MTDGHPLNPPARNVWLRSPNTGNTNNEYNINTSGSSNNNNANNSYAFLPDNAQITANE